jgi:hypothetical protein
MTYPPEVRFNKNVFGFWVARAYMPLCQATSFLVISVDNDKTIRQELMRGKNIIVRWNHFTGTCATINRGCIKNTAFVFNSSVSFGLQIDNAE